MKLKLLSLFLSIGVFVSCQSEENIGSKGYPAKIGFYDYDMSGNHRDTGNNLSSGDLTGRVQFGQTHTVEPKGNAELFLPDIISERDALLIFMPTDDIASSIKDISVEIILDGTVKTTLQLSSPIDIPKSDNFVKTDHEIVYSTKAWTTEISWQYMKKGLELRFISNKDDVLEKEGTLSANDIEFAAPSLGVFTFIRLGMLSEYRSSGSGYMLDSPGKAMADYFQTAPFAQIVNAKYDNISLSKVMLANGTIYDLASSQMRDRFSRSIGSVYAGDMRGNVAKSQISVGINLANFGYPSWDMSQSYPKHHYYMTTHLAQGRYQHTANGKLVDLPAGNNWNSEDYSSVIAHGLSGGNGIGTLLSTTGNEFSHEVGHAYGLGHFVKPNNKPAFWTHHHADSGWGYDVYNKMFKGNLLWNTKADQVKADNNFIGKYNYTPDTMSGGYGSSKISVYTRLTGYTLMKAQQYVTALSPTIVPKLYGGVDENKSSTGFLKWDKEKREMIEYPAPKWPEIYNVVHDTPFNPYRIGVPVITLLGAYIPDDLTNPESKAVLYPAFRGNYGNVYNLPAPDKREKACWVEVQYEDDTKKEIVIAPTMHKANVIANQLHINIEMALKPNKATIYCKEAGGGAVQLGNHIDIVTNLPAMDPAVIIGKEAGYEAAYKEDIKWLNQVLPKYDDTKLFIPLLTDAESTALLRVKDRLSNLNSSAKKVADQHIKLLNERDTVIDFIDLNSLKLSSNDTDSKNALLKLLVDKGFITNGSTPSIDRNYITKLKEGGNRCIDSEFPNTTPMCVDNKSSQEWIIDGVGKIHSATSPNLCLYDGRSYLSVVNCDDMIQSSTQHWVLDNQAENKYRIKGSLEYWRCIDYASSLGKFITYNCHTGGNQRFEIITKAETTGWNNKLLTIIPSKELKIIYDLFK